MQELLSATSPIRLDVSNSRQSSSTPINTETNQTVVNNTSSNEFYNKTALMQHYHNFSVNNLAESAQSRDWRHAQLIGMKPHFNETTLDTTTTELISQQEQAYPKMFAPTENCFSATNSNQTNIFSTISSVNHFKPNQMYSQQHYQQNHSPLAFQINNIDNYTANTYNMNQSQRFYLPAQQTSDFSNSAYLYNQYSQQTIPSTKYQMNTTSVVYGTKIESPATCKETENETEDDSINNSQDNKIKNLLISSTSSSSANSPNMLKINHNTQLNLAYNNNLSSSIISSSSSSFSTSPSNKNISSSSSPKLDYIKSEDKQTNQFNSINGTILNQLNSINTSSPLGVSNSSIANLSTISNYSNQIKVNGLSSSSSSSSSSIPNSTESFEWLKPVKSQPNGKTRTKDKYRVVYSEPQRVELEKEFLYSKYITIKRKSELSQTLSLSERQIKIWFQNRRAKDRKASRKHRHDSNVSSTTTRNLNAYPGDEYDEDEDEDEDEEDEDDENDISMSEESKKDSRVAASKKQSKTTNAKSTKYKKSAPVINSYNSTNNSASTSSDDNLELTNRNVYVNSFVDTNQRAVNPQNHQISSILTNNSTFPNATYTPATYNQHQIYNQQQYLFNNQTATTGSEDQAYYQSNLNNYSYQSQHPTDYSAFYNSPHPINEQHYQQQYQTYQQQQQQQQHLLINGATN